MSPRTLRVVNPATHEPVCDLPVDDDAALAAKLREARRAQQAWRRIGVTARCEPLRSFRELLVTHAETLARELTEETGKPITQARRELAGVLPRIDFFLENTAEALRPIAVGEEPHEGLRELITFDPLGVVAIISAWNYPYLVGASAIVPALLCGNAVLYKPSELAARTGLGITALLHRAGVPPDVLVPVIGAAHTGARLLECPIDGAFFTGSRAAGVQIARQLAGRMLPVQLELGGKDAAYVCEDADPEAAAVALADGAFYNAGQSCCAVERIYVHRAIEADFSRALVQCVRSFRIGDPQDPDTYIGPLTRPGQLDVLREQLADALDKGARVLIGGERLDRPGNYFSPTVVTGVDSSMRVMREESFGPIVAVQAVCDDEEAIARMDDSDYGLTAAVYTPDEQRARRILDRLQTGTAYWNCCDRVSPRLPWSGRRGSGLGTTLSVSGIRSFVRPRGWHLMAPAGASRRAGSG